MYLVGIAKISRILFLLQNEGIRIEVRIDEY